MGASRVIGGDNAVAATAKTRPHGRCRLADLGQPYHDALKFYRRSFYDYEHHMRTEGPRWSSKPRRLDGDPWGEKGVLFLSYAQDDQEIAGRIASWFGGQGIAVFNWLAPEQRGGRFLEQIQDAMRVADDFLVVMSPSYLTSYWCQREKNLALQREKDLRLDEPDRVYIHVLVVAETPLEDMGFLRDYDHVDLVQAIDIDPALTTLSDRLTSRLGEGVAINGMAAADPGLRALAARPDLPAGPDADARDETGANVGQPVFRNREIELEKLLRGLANPAGPHFWLAAAPPQLGKTWFVKRVRTEMIAAGWSANLVDLRDEPPEIRTNLNELVGRLFGIHPPELIDAEVQQDIAATICDQGRSHLCVLDSAELLDHATARALRACLSEIYRFIDEAADEVRLGLVVASRREDGWRGATPPPRISAISLTEFNITVVQQALRDLAHATDRDPFRSDLRPVAVLVHSMTEGLPALLSDCLLWIRQQHWVGLNRLKNYTLFKKLAEGYISGHLLSRDSLLSELRELTGETKGSNEESTLRALEQAYRALGPYRLFTQSHVRDQLEHNEELTGAVNDAGWTLPDLWNAISGTALLLRPLNEPWQEIHPAIRRLLHRYFYDSLTKQAQVHENALVFVKVWGERQYGKEQIVGLVECLWHEAMALCGANDKEFKDRLCESARVLSRELKESPLYTVDELRRYAAERIGDDDELIGVLGRVDHLADKIVGIVLSPPDSPEA
jgi:hypothetical protein